MKSGLCDYVLHNSIFFSSILFVPDDKNAIERRQNAMYAVTMIMDQRELPDDVYIPREVWHSIGKNTSWRDWLEKDN